jgi:small-conductance mechanosensitive channel
MEILSFTALHNSLQRWLICAGITLAVRVLLGFARRGLKGRLGRWLGRLPGKYDDAVVAAIAETSGWFLWGVALYTGSLALKLPKEVAHGVSVAAITLGLVQAGLWAQRILRSTVEPWTRPGQESGAAGTRPSTAAAAITFIGSLIIWALVAMVALQNAGIEIGALLAGLGVGGIAAALALQSVLGDLFASLSIFADRPFDLGDFIVVGDFMGPVDKVGLRSTRLNGLGGEQIVMPNGDLMKSRIRNYRRMSERRVVNKIGVVYDTSYEKLTSIPRMLREIVQGVPGVRFDRAHISGYGDSSLDIEIVYYVLSPDYNEFMDRQQAILFETFRRFEQTGIGFALPTRTLYLKQGDAAGGARSRA